MTVGPVIDWAQDPELADKLAANPARTLGTGAAALGQAFMIPELGRRAALGLRKGTPEFGEEPPNMPDTVAGGEGAIPAAEPGPGVSNSLTSFEDVAAHIRNNGKLPENFITKEEATALGWNPQKGNLGEVAVAVEK